MGSREKLRGFDRDGVAKCRSVESHVRSLSHLWL